MSTKAERARQAAEAARVAAKGSPKQPSQASGAGGAGRGSGRLRRLLRVGAIVLAVPAVALTLGSWGLALYNPSDDHLPPLEGGGSRIIKLPSGAQVSVFEQGPADGKPVLVLLGMMASRYDLDLLGIDKDGEAAAQAGVRVITVDRPGYGATGTTRMVSQLPRLPPVQSHSLTHLFNHSTRRVVQ